LAVRAKRQNIKKPRLSPTYRSTRRTVLAEKGEKEIAARRLRRSDLRRGGEFLLEKNVVNNEREAFDAKRGGEEDL